MSVTVRDLIIPQCEYIRDCARCVFGAGHSVRYHHLDNGRNVGIDGHLPPGQTRQCDPCLFPVFDEIDRDGAIDAATDALAEIWGTASPEELAVAAVGAALTFLDGLPNVTTFGGKA